MLRGHLIVRAVGAGVALTACTAPPPAQSAVTSSLQSPAPALTVAAAFDKLCGGPSAIPMEVTGSRHFVSVPLSGPKGQATLRFHVDTGGNTPGLMILKSAADRLGYASEDALPKVLRLGERDIALPDGARWIILDDTEPGAQSRPTSEHATRKRYSVGQIGAGFLSRFTVCIDPARGRLGLGDPREVRIDPASAPGIPVMMMPGGANHALYPFVQILIRNEGEFVGGYGVLLDTGATTSMLDENKVRYLKSKVPGWPLTVGAAGDADMIAGAYPEAMVRVSPVAITAPKAKFPDRPEIDVGPATFVARPTGTWGRMFGNVPYTMGSHGAIANDVLNRFRLLLDYQAERLWLEPTGRKVDDSASTTRVGVALRFGDDGCPVIQQVTESNAPATLSALAAGDVLLAVGERDACRAWHHEVQAALSGDAGQKRKLGIRRGTTVLDVEVPVVDLLPLPRR